MRFLERLDIKLSLIAEALRSDSGTFSTSTLKKVEATQWAQENSEATGKGLCIYLVGGIGGLERHIREKKKLGFKNLRNHIIVEVDPNTAINLAKVCKKKYPSITVIHGKLEDIPEVLFKYIEHLDYDGIEPMQFSIYDYLERVLKHGGINNLHWVGQGRSPKIELSGDQKVQFIDPNVPGQKRQKQKWLKALKATFDTFFGDEFHTNYYTYNSGGAVEKGKPRKVTIYTTDGNMLIGHVSPKDYIKLVKLWQHMIQGFKYRPTGAIEIEVGSGVQEVSLDAISKLQEGNRGFAPSPMVMALLQRKDPTVFNVDIWHIRGLLETQFERILELNLYTKDSELLEELGIERTAVEALCPNCESKMELGYNKEYWFCSSCKRKDVYYDLGEKIPTENRAIADKLNEAWQIYTKHQKSKSKYSYLIKAIHQVKTTPDSITLETIDHIQFLPKTRSTVFELLNDSQKWDDKVSRQHIINQHLDRKHIEPVEGCPECKKWRKTPKPESRPVEPLEKIEHTCGWKTRWDPDENWIEYATRRDPPCPACLKLLEEDTCLSSPQRKILSERK
jgi:hypothetical protein